jgi:type VI secretion system protein ImpA
MSADLFEMGPLLAPMSGDAPSGPELDYDPQYQALELAGAGKPERQWGEKIYPAELPDWPKVLELALPLAARSRDLRVALWLLRCGARMQGLVGAARGLQLVQGLLEGLWDTVHPQLDASDGNDPTMRLNALAPLLSSESVLADLRAATIAPTRGSITLREVELGLGRAEAAAGEATPTEAGVLQAVEDLLSRHAGVATSVRAAHGAATAISALLERRVGADRAPDFLPLTRLLQVAVDALGRVQRSPAVAPLAAAAAASGDGAVAGPAVPTGAIRSRADAIRELERVCEWIERNEPSHPAPLLIRRAQRLMNKNFLDIIRDLAPDGLNQVEHIAGAEAQA